MADASLTEENKPLGVADTRAGYQVATESTLLLPPGYKQTEVGVIPEDWEVHTIGDSMSLINGRAFKPRDWKTQGLPIIRIQNLNDADSQFNYFSGPVEERHRIETGDLLFAWSGTTGTSFGARVWNGPAGVLNQHIFKVIPDQKRLTPTYALLALGKVQEAIEKQAHGFKASFVHVKKSDLVDVQLPHPATNAEQRAIAAALSDVDALIGGLDRLIAKKRGLKQAAMQQLLTGQTRLPGYSGDWVVTQMASLGQTYGGLAGKTKVDFGHGSARYIPFMNVMTDTVIDPNWLELVDVAPMEVQNRVQKGDLFFNGSSETPEEVGFCAVLMGDIHDLYLNSFCFGFRFNAAARVNGLFFAYWFRSSSGRTAMSILAQGATRYNIAKKAFLKLEIPQPTVQEQTAIATVLSDIDAEITALEARREKTRALKQGMMQELLTGRIRLV